MGIHVPEEFGGSGMSFTQCCIAIEELAKVDPAISVIVDIQNTLINTSLMRFGTPEQQATWLPRLCSDTLASFCLSESTSGSDAFALKTSAKHNEADDTYTINGSKLWISNAKEAGLFLVLANVDPSLGHRGITAFLVERETPGLIVGKKEDKLGIRASSTCEVVFDNLVVPGSAILGKKGEGYKIAIEGLNEGRIGIGAQMLGLAQGAFSHAMDYLHERKQFGNRIADFQGVQFDMARTRTDIEASKLMVYNAARLKDAGEPFVLEAAMCKLYTSQAAERVASQCVEFYGGVGYTKVRSACVCDVCVFDVCVCDVYVSSELIFLAYDICNAQEYPAEKYFRDAKIGSIYEGTSNLQMATIAKIISSSYTK
jgi:alkylation response protein AidB-like acyl-CoA dehydrogenase